jgi:Calcineurin-like phosphoesterase
MLHTRRRAPGSVLALLAGLLLVVPTRADEPPCEFDKVERIVAVGDVHGAYNEFVEILKTAGILDARDRWAAGRTHFVQTGDLVDRGPDSRKALDLLQRLERDASRAGGRVHALIGNHEAMWMLGDLRYVSAGEYAAFTTKDSESLRRQVIETLPEEQREALFKNTPLGMIELVRAFGPKGQYGEVLRKRNAVVRINGLIFMHGGISPAIASMRCAEINATVRKDLAGGAPPADMAPAQMLTTREDGPLWYRGLSTEPAETFAPQLDAILTAQQARGFVIGHSVSATGSIQTRFDGKVIMIDTAMLPGYAPKGRASALEIRGGVFTAIYKDGREVILKPSQEVAAGTMSLRRSER